MPYAKYTPEEVESRGEAIYEQEIRSKVEPQHKGKFLVLDVETGEYEIDEDDLTATKRVLAKRPDAVLYGLRIGHPAAYRLGAHVRLLQPSRRVAGVERSSPPARRQHRRNYNDPGHAHELTFSCYNGFKFLASDRTCRWLAESIEHARAKLDFDLWAYVFMPEHAHLVIHP